MSKSHSDCECPGDRPSLLIAGCGYLGMVVAEQWIDHGGRVLALTRSSQRAAELAAMGVEPVVGQLQRPGGLTTLPQADAVLWAVGFDRSSGDPRQAVWIEGLHRVLEALPVCNSPRRFVYVSSTGVYGDAAGGEVNEDTVPLPSTESGQMCLQAEQSLLQSLRDHHPQTSAVILRMAGIYGPHRLLRRVEDLRNQTPITAPAEDWLNLIHVDDAATMVRKMATAGDQPPGRREHAALLNVVNTGTLTRLQYYSELARLVGAPAPVFANPNAVGPESTAIAGNGTQSNNLTRRGRQPSGNKRVVSVYRSQLPGLKFQFDNVVDGLRDAFRRSNLG